MRCYHFRGNSICVLPSDLLIVNKNGYVCSKCGRKFTNEEYETIKGICNMRIKRNPGIIYEMPARRLSVTEVKFYLEKNGLAGSFICGLKR